MKYILLLIAALALLFGCPGNGGVTQADYDSLKASCAQEKSSLSSEIASAKAVVEGTERRLSDCVAEGQAREELLGVKDSEIATLQADSDLLARAQEKAAIITAYGNLTTYYNDAYGPGKILNTAKLNRIEAQVAQLDDAALAQLWGGLKNCQTITTCDSAKTAFVAKINANVVVLNAQVAAIVAE